MTPREKAQELVDKYRIILMDEDTDCGNEVLCTLIAIKNAKVAVDEIITSEPRNPSNVDWDDVGGTHQYYYEAQREEAVLFWLQVKEELNNI